MPGKTFVAVNFAAVVGASDKKVLLVDSDMRKGYIHQYFGLSREKGLSELLSGHIQWQEAIRKDVLPNVDLIPTGVIPPNPSELLLSSHGIATLQTISSHYDLVVIDSAPILAVSDALAIAPHVGITFLVARSGHTSLGELDESTKRIRQAGGQVKGVILNDQLAAKRRYGSKYGYYRYTNYEY